MLGAQFAEQLKEDVDVDPDPEVEPGTEPFTGEMSDTAVRRPGEASKRLAVARAQTDTKPDTLTQTTGRYA